MAYTASEAAVNCGWSRMLEAFPLSTNTPPPGLFLSPSLSLIRSFTLCPSLSFTSFTHSSSLHCYPTSATVTAAAAAAATEPPPPSAVFTALFTTLTHSSIPSFRFEPPASRFHLSFRRREAAFSTSRTKSLLSAYVLLTF